MSFPAKEDYVDSTSTEALQSFQFKGHTMSDTPKPIKQPPRTKENFFETFKDLLGLTSSNLDAKYQFYLTHPFNIEHVFEKSDA